MFNPFKKKKTQEQIEVDKAAEAIRFKAETEERLKLAEDHGKYDANKKYGKFKQLASGNILSKVILTAKNTGKTLQKIDTEQVKKRIEKMTKELEDL